MEKFILSHKGTEVFKGTENECYIKLQRSQSQSADWAMKYEGWKIEEEKTFLTDEQLKTHVKNNTSNNDYNFNNWRDLLEFDYKTGVSVNLEKLKEKSFLIDKIEKNFSLAEERINNKLNFDFPSVGDFIKIDKKYFRIGIGFYDDNNKIENFQYTEGGSFHMSKDGFCSYSGGFSFDYGGRIEVKALKLTKEKKEGSFWFFSRENVGAQMGVYFNGSFKVWKVDTKQLNNI